MCMITLIVTLLLLVCGSISDFFLIGPSLRVAKVSVEVVDEEGRPVEGADVGITFNLKSTTREATKGGTDRSGIFSTVGWSRGGVIRGAVRKPHYYDSFFSHNFYVTRLLLWQPWDKKFKVMLRRVVNPVPMYERNSSFTFPVMGKKVGFDLVKSDWVKPYGTGNRPDIFFLWEYRDDGQHYEATLSITFPDPNDGIVLVKDPSFDYGSEYRLPRVAPAEGYRSIHTKRISTGRGYGYQSDVSTQNNYIFRVRTERVNGKISRAMYGKIVDDIGLSPSSGEHGAMHIHYYLNPDHTRNLEFDPKKNLFTSLPETEGVALP